MGQLSASKVVNAIYGLLSGVDASDAVLLRSLLGRVKSREVINDGGVAATPVAEKAFYQNTSGTNIRIVSITLTTPVAVTANDTNNATVSVFTRNSAGLSQVLVSSLTTNLATGNLVALSPKAFPIPTVILAPDSVLTVTLTKAGTGAIIGAANGASALVETVLEPTD